MKLSSKYILPLAVLVASASALECVTTSNVDSEIWEAKVEPVDSSSWSIEYFNTYKILTNIASNVTYLLYQCGSEIPDIDTSVFSATVEIPVTSVGITQTPTLTYLEQLGQRDKITAFLTKPEYIASPCFRDLVENGDIATLVDPDNSSLAELNGGDVTAVADLVVFDSEFGTLPFETKIVVTEYVETTNKAYFEWLKYFSVFFNAEEVANNVVEMASDRYDCITENANSATDDSAKETVVWGYYSAFCEGWDVAECTSNDGTGNYYCEYAKACGVQMLSSTNGTLEVCGTTMMTTEEFVNFGKDAEYWFFNAMDWEQTYEMFKDDLDQMKSVQNQHVYDYQGSGDDAWFEQRIAEYYNVLQDFCHVVGRAVSLKTRHWWRNVFTEPVGTRLEECTPTTASSILNDGYTCNLGGNGSVIVEETETESETENGIDTETEIETEDNSDNEAESEAESDVENETETESESQSESSTASSALLTMTPALVALVSAFVV